MRKWDSMVSEESNQETQDDLPRPGSALYKLRDSDEEKRKKAIKKYKRLNKYLILPLYRIGLLPLIGFGRIFLILKTKGRKTGKRRRTPLEYHRINDVIHIFSGRGEEADWLKNIKANPDEISVRHGFHWYPITAEFVENSSEKEEIYKWYVTEHKSSAKMLFGWDPKRDDPETTDFSQLINMVPIIRLYRKSD